MIRFEFLGINGSSQDLHGGNTSLLISGEQGNAAVDLSCNLAVLVDRDIDAVILTHEHIDHIYGLPSLLHQAWIGGRTKGLNIYIPKGMESLVNALIDTVALRSKKGMFDIRILTQEVFDVGSLHITTFETDHANTSMGIVVEENGTKLVYTSDTRPIRVLPPQFEGASVLIHEASGVEAGEEVLIRKGHSSGADAGRTAKTLGVKTLYLCHLPKGDEPKEAVLQDAQAIFEKTVVPQMLCEYCVE